MDQVTAFFVFGQYPIVSVLLGYVTEVVGAVVEALIDGSPIDSSFIDGVIDINKCDSVPIVLTDLLLVLFYNVPVVVEVGVPISSEGFVVSQDGSSLIDYFSRFSSVNGTASEVNEPLVDVEELVSGVVGKVVGPSPSFD